MPELPEAETIARDLDPRLRGARILAVGVHHPDVLARPAPELGDALLGRTIAGVGRRGKNVVVAFEDEGRLMVNLGMTGRLVLSDSPRAAELRHVAVRLDLEDGRALLYDDTRRFGRLELYEPEAWPARDAELGLEPLDDAFTGDALWALTRRTRTPVRNFLLDQSKVSGVGNIYALEALFRAGIRPTRRSHRITRHRGRRPARRPAPGPCQSHPAPRYHVLGLPRRIGRGGRLRAAATGIRAGGAAVPDLRHRHPPEGADEPVRVLLPGLPALTRGRPGQRTTNVRSRFRSCVLSSATNRYSPGASATPSPPMSSGHSMPMTPPGANSRFVTTVMHA
jgi:formamidopyrimidine-DNA glycosylase